MYVYMHACMYVYMYDEYTICMYVFTLNLWVCPIFILFLQIRSVSNYRDNSSVHAFKGGNKEIWFPSKEDLMKYRVLVVTLVTSGR